MTSQKPFTEITSANNEQFKLWKKLLESKGIKKEKSFLLMGEKLIKEAIAGHFQKPSAAPSKTQSNDGSLLKFNFQAELITRDMSALSPAMNIRGISGKPLPVFRLESPLFNELDVIGTNYNLFVSTYPEIPQWDPLLDGKENQDHCHLHIVIPLGDPGNLGALIRSATAFGASKIILTTESANPFLPKAIKASAGTLLTAPLFKGPSLKEVFEHSQELVCLDSQGTSIQKFNWPLKTVLVVGEEGSGLSSNLSKAKDQQTANTNKRHIISIPMGSVESLNATVAASIAMYAFNSTARLM